MSLLQRELGLRGARCLSGENKINYSRGIQQRVPKTESIQNGSTQFDVPLLVSVLHCTSEVHHFARGKGLIQVPTTTIVQMFTRESTAIAYNRDMTSFINTQNTVRHMYKVD